MIYSFSNNQHEILHSISRLYLGGQRFGIDLCYNKGGFYSRDHETNLHRSRIPAPEIKADLLPSGPEIKKMDCRSTGLAAASIKSVVFDPPFLIGNNLMTKRYGGFNSAGDLFSFQDASLLEISRIIKPGGILVTKIQDFVHGSQKYFPSVYQVIKARECGLMLLDSFILVNKNRYRGKNAGTLTSVSAHCFFHVFQKKRRRHRITRY